MVARIPQFYGSAHIKKKKDWQSLAVGPYTCPDFKHVLYIFIASHNKVSSATGVQPQEGTRSRLYPRPPQSPTFDGRFPATVSRSINCRLRPVKSSAPRVRSTTLNIIYCRSPVCYQERFACFSTETVGIGRQPRVAALRNLFPIASVMALVLDTCALFSNRLRFPGRDHGEP
jgi:hypothetical protein